MFGHWLHMSCLFVNRLLTLTDLVIKDRSHRLSQFVVTSDRRAILLHLLQLFNRLSLFEVLPHLDPIQRLNNGFILQSSLPCLFLLLLWRRACRPDAANRLDHVAVLWVLFWNRGKVISREEKLHE
jgi:hypothetical protein